MAYHGKYETPKELLADADLDNAEKLRLLRLWRDDKKDYLRASDEGMEGEVSADLLSEIKEAILLVEDNLKNEV